MERAIETALGAAGDFAAAAVWRQACRELASGLRVVVLGLDAEAVARLAERLRAANPRVRFPTATLDPRDPEGEDAALGAQDALLGAHAALWATPVTAALGAAEREALLRLAPLWPDERAVVLTDVHLLARLADDPEAEAAQVRARLTALAPPGWSLIAVEDLPARLDDLLARHPALTRARRVAVARALLAEAQDRTRAALAESEAAQAEAEALLDAEDDALDRARRRGERIAAHLLGALHGHTEALLVDLRGFLHTLEGDLPAQIDDVTDLGTARRALPRWLDHVVEAWMSRRLDAWRAAVLADLAEVRIDPEEARRAELLPPTLHPAPLRAEAGWGRRLAITAALGGGAALALVGLLVPGALLAGSGLAVSVLTQEDAEASRERLVDAARSAVRRMSADAERLLTEQLAQITAELDTLGDREAREAEAGRAALRATLTERRAWHRNRILELRSVLEALAIRAEALPETTA